MIERDLIYELLPHFHNRGNLSVYLALYALGPGLGRREVEAGYSSLSKLCGLSTQSVKTAILTLRKRGWITLTEAWRQGMKGSRYEVFTARQILRAPHLLPEDAT